MYKLGQPALSLFIRFFLNIGTNYCISSIILLLYILNSPFWQWLDFHEMCLTLSLQLTMNYFLSFPFFFFFNPLKLSWRHVAVCIPWSEEVVAWVECVCSPARSQCSLHASVAMMVVILSGNGRRPSPWRPAEGQKDVLESFCKSWDKLCGDFTTSLTGDQLYGNCK